MPRFLPLAFLAAALPVGAIAAPPAYCDLLPRDAEALCSTVDSFARAGLTNGYESNSKEFKFTLRLEKKNLIVKYNNKTHRTPYQGVGQC